MNFSISVIVPVWNREKLIGRCLESIMTQTRKPDELIVADNNSTDNTASTVSQLFENYSGKGVELKYLIETRQGACFARQTGLENVHTEWVIFFDSDDVMRPNLIAEAYKKIKEKPETDIVCWKCRIKQLDGSFREPPILDNPLESHLIHTLLRPQGYMVRRSFLEMAGGWTKPLNVWNDFELGLRLLLQNPRISFVNKVLADIYAQKESITGTEFSSKEGEWEKALREMRKSNNEAPNSRAKKIEKILDYRTAILAAHYWREGNREGAEKLFREIIADKKGVNRLALKFSYLYTRIGMRGAWRIIRKVYLRECKIQKRRS